jgi:two-component system, OmpR family, response regulator Irr
LSGIKLVVADDDDTFRESLVLFLTNYFEVLDAVADGEELINSVTLANPDVIVSDVYMPTITGPEVMQELDKLGIIIPFVFIGAMDDILGDHDLFVSKVNIAHQLVPAIHKSMSG